MHDVRSLLHAELPGDDNDAPPVGRAALAGGSDHRPPDDQPTPAQIIRFPVERVRRNPPQNESRDSEPEAPSARDAEREGQPLWSAWMARILRRGAAGPPHADRTI